MSTGFLSPIGVMVQQLSNQGLPLSGGQVFTYQAGTTTPIATYTDSTLTVQNANPIVLNSAGRLPNSVWVGSNQPHKMVLEDANNNVLSTIDNMYGINDPYQTNQTIFALPTSSGTANAQIVSNLTAISALQLGTEQWFIPGVVNTGPTTVNVDSTGAKNVFYLGKSLVGGELEPQVPVLIKYDNTQWNLSWSAKGPAQDYYVDSGSANALVVTANFAQGTTPVNGLRIKVKVANTTTSNSPTIAINGGSAQTIYYSDGTTGLVAGSLILNNIYTLTWNSSISGWTCSDPSRVTGSFTATGTGFTSTAPTCTVTYRIDASYTFATLVFGTGMSGTSNSTSFTMTGMPALLTPIQTQSYYTTAENSSAVALNASIIFTAASTTITLAQTASGGIGGGATNWTASGTKGFSNGAVTGTTIAINIVLN